MLQTWPANTIPLPEASLFIGPVPIPSSPIVPAKKEPLPMPKVEQVIDANDHFSKGRVIKYFPLQGYGFITDQNGREIYFNLSELDFIGAKDKKDLIIGITIGYDISWTSHGLHVKKLKIY